MSATTADVIVDRIRSVCAGAPFYLTEAVAWSTFEQQPTTNIDAIFRIPPPSSQSVSGGFSFSEDRVDSLQVWVARKYAGNYAAVRQALLRDLHSLTAAIVRDAHVSSGDYGILDGGRGHAISADLPGVEYVTLRVTYPVNYEAQL